MTNVTTKVNILRMKSAEIVLAYEVGWEIALLERAEGSLLPRGPYKIEEPVTRVSMMFEYHNANPTHTLQLILMCDPASIKDVAMDIATTYGCQLVEFDRSERERCWSALVELDKMTTLAHLSFRMTSNGKCHAKLQFTVTIIRKQTQSAIVRGTTPLISLSKSLDDALLFNPKLADAVLLVKSGTTTVDIPVSKFSLASASKVFYNIFTQGVSESRDTPTRVHIVDASEASVKAMVEYAHRKTISAALNNMMERKQLYDLAERYKMLDLGQVVAQMIVKQDLNMINVFELLNFFEKHSNPALYTACLEFFLDNRNSMSEAVFDQAFENGGEGVKKAMKRIIMSK
ncbi:hypothetical protein SeLEV6574_g07831 [Synchytrium endobioticum]|uniref:BTB domain-containing protein n=1 Tax=Synchytrium endobioticum TaxID=286115 RepID=A0A507CEJ6_9FUNG|nr:hypothetical protein SeLEV6574_g07831 [Synchytrium endobioticum]